MWASGFGQSGHKALDYAADGHLALGHTVDGLTRYSPQGRDTPGVILIGAGDMVEKLMTKIMIIEDDETMLSLIRTLLELEGFQVVDNECVEDLERTIEALRQERPGLVLLDVHLRCFNGFDLLQRIRQDEELKRTRVLMTSGMELSFQCGQAGADGFILKPYMPDDLIMKIRDTLGN